MPQVVLLQYKTLLWTKLVNSRLIKNSSNIKHYYKTHEAQIFLYSENQRILFLWTTPHGSQVCSCFPSAARPCQPKTPEGWHVLQCQLSSNIMLQKVGVIKRFYKKPNRNFYRTISNLIDHLELHVKRLKQNRSPQFQGNADTGKNPGVLQIWDRDNSIVNCSKEKKCWWKIWLRSDFR